MGGEIGKGIRILRQATRRTRARVSDVTEAARRDLGQKAQAVESFVEEHETGLMIAGALAIPVLQELGLLPQLGNGTRVTEEPTPAPAGIPQLQAPGESSPTTNPFGIPEDTIVEAGE